MKFFSDLWKIISTAEFRNYFFQGFLNTLIITFIAALIGLIIGFIVAIIKIIALENKYFKIPGIICDVYTTVIRGTPVALQLFVMVFAIILIKDPTFSAVPIILTFGINSGAYVSENIRAGILSVDKGQTEAGRSLGLSQVQTMSKIVIPQAIKNVIPAIGNELIALLKETSIISIVGSTVGTLTFDLNSAANTVAHAKEMAGAYLASAVVAAMFYLVIVYLITYIIKVLEKRLRASDKR